MMERRLRFNITTQRSYPFFLMIPLLQIIVALQAQSLFRGHAREAPQMPPLSYKGIIRKSICAPRTISLSLQEAHHIRKHLVPRWC